MTGIDKERVKESVKRLVSAGTIDKKFANLKDKMAPFEKGDYVKFTDAVYDAYTKGLYYSDNVFKISQIKADGTLRLVDIDEDVPIKDVEAIPMDGIHDRNLYYDPIIMASNVAPGQPVPVHHSQRHVYYLDGLENTKYNNNTLRQIVLDHSCQFVHEVQHCLRDEINNDDLKLNETIKAKM